MQGSFGSRGGRHVVIIGSGASGTILAAHLLRDSADDIRVTLIEQREAVGVGLAYSTTHSGHLLNVRAANMSAFADQPGHFAAWLARNGGSPELSPDSFVERRIYGAYIASLIAPYQEAGQGDRLSIIHAAATGLRLDDTAVSVTLGDGRVIVADVAVVATGNEGNVPTLGGADLYDQPWLRPRYAGIHEAAAVLILGTGLTMIDYVLWLHANEHCGRIYALSTRGRLPQVHQPTEPAPISDKDIPYGSSLVTHMRWLRGLVARRAQQGKDWRSVVDAVRPYTWRLWQELPDAERSRFLRHARPWWDSHRHRMAPEVNAIIRSLISRGQLEIITGRLLEARRDATGIVCTYRPRGGRERATLRVAGIVDCTGLSSDIANSRNPLIRKLLADGIARPGSQGLGLDTTRDWRIIDATGERRHQLYAIGPLTRGTAWETIAVPDIRLQCAEIARAIAAAEPAQETPRTASA